MVWNNIVLYFQQFTKSCREKAFPQAFFQEWPTENGFSLTTCVYTSLLVVLQVKVQMLCEFWGLGVWSIEVNKAAAGCGVLKAPAFKHMQGHPKLQGVTHTHISKRIRATSQKCFHVLISKVRNQTDIWILNVQEEFACTQHFSHGAKILPRTAYCLVTRVIVSVFLVCLWHQIRLCFPASKVWTFADLREQKLVINTTSPPPLLHFIKSLLYYTL